MLQERLDQTIRNIPDFPKPGINFKDITPILKDHQLSHDIAQSIADRFGDAGIDAIVGVESRGFLFGMMIASILKVPFVTVRKKGKLPYETVSYSYNLEYGSAEVEMHVDALQKGWKVLIQDDLLATGGTAMAAAELVKKVDAEVAGFAFVIELAFLGGVSRLEKYSKEIYNLISY